MFKFDFNFEGTNEPVDPILQDSATSEEKDSQKSQRPSLETSNVDDLIGFLPPLISYSPLRIPLANDRHLMLIRRDLFDARFQLISESPTADTSVDLAFIDAPSDLVPEVYEGGLKTWECSADLAGYLDGVDVAMENSSCRILEVGCGTAVPSLLLVRRLFSAEATNTSLEAPRTIIHLQDYNSIVLQLVTLPNIILTWYASPASKSYRANQDPPLSEVNYSEPGELPLTPELISAFVESLKARYIEVTFISGSWTDVDVWIRENQLAYDLVLTSETIYRPSSLPSLISLLRSASTHGAAKHKEEPPSHELTHLNLRGITQNLSGLCLVAAKVIYFGVGGGVEGFEKAAREAGGRPKTVFERKAGVSRRIIQVDWKQDRSE